jgi:hypothetical protein
MKFYLAVDHTEDEDADYFMFTSLHLAVRYIQEEKLHAWMLCDEPFEEFPLDDYTFIG